MQRKTDPPRILVVDDCPESIRLLGEILHPEYEVLVATDGEKALEIARGQPAPDLVLLDILMPGMGGYEVCRRLKTDPRTAPTPVIFTTSMDGTEDERYGFAIGAADYITKPLCPPIVRARVRVHTALYDRDMELQRRADEHIEALHRTQLEIIRGLGRAAEFKDNETGFHVLRMSHYTRLIAEALQVPREWSELLLHAAPMHDIGKIGVPDTILLKPGRLDAEEWEIMKRHCQYGVDILGEYTSELMNVSRTIAYTHHEKWDGSGYPRGLKERDIPLAGRIVAIADAFDALTTERPYKAAWSVEEAIAYIDESSGSHFDPYVVSHFHAILPQILEIGSRYAESGVDDRFPLSGGGMT